MTSIKAINLVNKMDKDLQNGFDIPTLIADLKELRPIIIEEKDPHVVKAIRLVYEHLEKNGSFMIALPEDEAIEELEEVATEEGTQEAVAAPVAEPVEIDQMESIQYFVSLLKNTKNKMNRRDIMDMTEKLLAQA